MLTIDEIIAAWLDAKHRCNQTSPEFLILRQAVIHSLANGQPIAAHHVAAVTGLSLETVDAHFVQLHQWGAEFDESDRLSGLALSLTPTPHRLRVNGRTLYAWCALDTLLLPGLLGQPAEVKSICPATGEPIQLTITPTGVTFVQPSSTVLSVVVPGVSAVCEACGDGEATRAACHRMHFFCSQEAAANWLGSPTDVAVLTPEAAWQLAYAAWIEPVAKVLPQTQ
jgi:alkylmercury lyase